MKKLSLIITLLVALTACNTKAKLARDYNNAIVMKDRGLLPAVTACEQNVKKYYETGQYDSIAVEGKRMEQLIQNKIDEINELPVPDVNGVEKFKKAYTDYFKTAKRRYTNYTALGMAGTDEQRQEVLKDIRDFDSQAQDLLNDLQKQQQEFAKANNFRIDK